MIDAKSDTTGQSEAASPVQPDAAVRVENAIQISEEVKTHLEKRRDLQNDWIQRRFPQYADKGEEKEAGVKIKVEVECGIDDAERLIEQLKDVKASKASPNVLLNIDTETIKDIVKKTGSNKEDKTDTEKFAAWLLELDERGRRKDDVKLPTVQRPDDYVLELRMGRDESIKEWLKEKEYASTADHPVIFVTDEPTTGEDGTFTIAAWTYDQEKFRKLQKAGESKDLWYNRISDFFVYHAMLRLENILGRTAVPIKNETKALKERLKESATTLTDNKAQEKNKKQLQRDAEKTRKDLLKRVNENMKHLSKEGVKAAQEQDLDAKSLNQNCAKTEEGPGGKRLISETPPTKILDSTPKEKFGTDNEKRAEYYQFGGGYALTTSFIDSVMGNFDLYSASAVCEVSALSTSIFQEDDFNSKFETASLESITGDEKPEMDKALSSAISELRKAAEPVLNDIKKEARTSLEEELNGIRSDKLPRAEGEQLADAGLQTIGKLKSMPMTATGVVTVATPVIVGVAAAAAWISTGNLNPVGTKPEDVIREMTEFAFNPLVSILLAIGSIYFILRFLLGGRKTNEKQSFSDARKPYEAAQKAYLAACKNLTSGLYIEYAKRLGSLMEKWAVDPRSIGKPSEFGNDTILEELEQTIAGQQKSSVELKADIKKGETLVKEGGIVANRLRSLRRDTGALS